MSLRHKVPLAILLCNILACFILATKACGDVYKNCATYKANGDCRNGKYEKWMKTYCAKTCKLCSAREDKCRDIFSHCAYFASQEVCRHPEYEKWARSRCAKTCQFCGCEDSPYGCCQDRKSFADGPGGQGCAMKLCVDKLVCDKYKELCGDINIDSNYELKKFLKDNCPYTCGYCKALSPRLACEWSNPVYGCCWNGQKATGPNKQGCPACVDSYRRACGFWRADCGKAKFYNIRQFLETECPSTCGLCNDNFMFYQDKK